MFCNIASLIFSEDNNFTFLINISIYYISEFLTNRPLKIMTSNSESPDRTTLTTADDYCVAMDKSKACLRLRLSRVFGPCGPKSPKSVSRGSSPNRGGPHARYSWQPGTSDSEENRSPHSPKSWISSSSSKSSNINTTSSSEGPSTPKSPFTPKTPSTPKSPSTPKNSHSSTWYVAER